jgi:threonine synthase
MGEGGTPLFPARNLGLMLGLPYIFIKDERQGPTASFKDRQAATTVAALAEAGITEAVVASTGNVAIAFSAYCARAGIKLWAFLTSLVPADKMHEVALYGTQVVKVTSTYDQAKRLAAEFAQKRGLYLDRGTRSIASVESMKTVAFEIAEQLAGFPLPSPKDREGATPWRGPDWYFQAVSGGLGPFGVLKGFHELAELGLIHSPPGMAIIQAAGCSPMAAAWQQGREVAEPVDQPSTYITTLSTGDPGRAYTLLRSRMLASGRGAMESVTDEEAFSAMRTVAGMEGLSMEPAAAVAFAGLFKLARSGMLQRDDLIVVNCSGHTMPIEKHLLGDGWARSVVVPPASLPESPQEGLLSALAQLDMRRTRQILIVDDHADARLLIKRILQVQGEFVIREASGGSEALAAARQAPPDLIVLDLMMPEVDGFAVLDELKRQPETVSVPVIVVTAKELTASEKKRLEGQIARLMVKGSFLGEDLVREVGGALD